MNKLLMGVLLFIVQCAPAASDKPEVPVFFRADIQPDEQEYSQDLKEILQKPVPEGITEKAIMEYFGNQRPRIWSYMKPIQKTIGEKSFQFDRVISFMQVETRSLNRDAKGQTVAGSEMIERVEVIFFLNRGVSVYHLVDHVIRKNRSQEWITGPLHTNDASTKRESWPGCLKDGTIYWMQRPDRHFYVGNIERSAKELGVTEEAGYYIVPME